MLSAHPVAPAVRSIAVRAAGYAFGIRQPARLASVLPRVQRSPESIVDPVDNVDNGDQENINPKTGNPQTGKLPDVYFEVGSMLVVVVLAFWSLWNVRSVLDPVGAADKLREPAPKMEWSMTDNQPVYGPCGELSNADEALRDLLDGKPCPTNEYNRLPPAAQQSG